MSLEPLHAPRGDPQTMHALTGSFQRCGFPLRISFPNRYAWQRSPYCDRFALILSQCLTIMFSCDRLLFFSGVATLCGCE